MSERKDGYIPPQLPRNWEEQRQVLSIDLEDRNSIAVGFHSAVTGVLVNAGIPIFDSSFRAKSDESIKLKLQRKLLATPLVDLYGTRFIIDEANIDPATRAILEEFNPPVEYPWGTPSVIDHRKPEEGSRYTSSLYKAVHVYVPFGESKTQNIGEVQLLTPQWMKTADKTRNAYERRQERHS